jgi:uncharacterized protein (DUF362 family)
MNLQIERVPDYDPQTVREAVFRMAEAYGLPQRLEACRTVLVKPNLLGPFPPEKAVTTHPVVVAAVVEYLQRLGKEVTIGDSPGGTVPWERVIATTGMKDVAGRYRVSLVNLAEGGAPSEAGISLSRIASDADAVVNLAKYKTHSLMLYTGAVKNLYGLVPGLLKAELHRRYPSPEAFRHILAEIYRRIRPQIAWNLIDGILGMEGEGPSAGTPRKFGVLMSGDSGAGLDTIAARMMGFSLADLPYLAECLHDEGIDPRSITAPVEWRGFRFPRVAIREVKFRQWTANRIPKGIFKVFVKLFDFEPRFTPDCRMCGVCRDGCPVNAIRLIPGAKTPELDRKLCIKCMCCHELCPFSAVTVHKRWLARRMLRS